MVYESSCQRVDNTLVNGLNCAVLILSNLSLYLLNGTVSDVIRVPKAVCFAVVSERIFDYPIVTANKNHSVSFILKIQRCNEGRFIS